jgi:aminoglycoside phosphotransferase (APT) family kinase protein
MSPPAGNLPAPSESTVSESTVKDSLLMVPGVEHAQLMAWLGRLDSDLAPPVTARRLGVGQSNLTYLLSDAAGHRWVLRRPPMGHLLSSAHDVLREARILSSLAPTGVPAPQIYGVAQAGEIGDAPLVLMEFVDGVVISDVAASQTLPAPGRHSAGIALPETLGRIHAVDLGAVNLTDLASHSPYSQRQLKRWSGQWERSKTRELADLDLLTDRLRAAVPPPRKLSLVHGDLHLRNIVVSDFDGEILAALDWELATLGDPIADLGTTLAYWPENDETVLPEFRALLLPGYPSRAELVERYCVITGHGVTDAELGFWHSLALWKIAIIAEGILRRAQQDSRNRADSGVPDHQTVNDLVALAHDIAARAGI